MPVVNANDLCREMHSDQQYNSIAEVVKRGQGRILQAEATVTGTGSVNQNVFQITGSVLVLRQWALITEVTTLTNMTDVYADLWDGTNSVKLTKTPGAVLSNAPVGTYFTKDKASTETYSVALSDQCRMIETTNKEASPFVVTQKNATNTYIRFNYTTTDSPLSFKMHVYFEYYPLNGGTIAFV